jgi:hypothetical protein
MIKGRWKSTQQSGKLGVFFHIGFHAHQCRNKLVNVVDEAGYITTF